VREKELGSDPLDVEAHSFLERFEGRKGGVSAALMNQKDLAGIGNVYSDERCPRGNGEIRKIKAAGRTLYYYPACLPKAR